MGYNITLLARTKVRLSYACTSRFICRQPTVRPSCSTKRSVLQRVLIAGTTPNTTHQSAYLKKKTIVPLSHLPTLTARSQPLHIDDIFERIPIG